MKCKKCGSKMNQTGIEYGKRVFRCSNSDCYSLEVEEKKDTSGITITMTGNEITLKKGVQRKDIILKEDILKIINMQMDWQSIAGYLLTEYSNLEPCEELEDLSRTLEMIDDDKSTEVYRAVYQSIILFKKFRKDIEKHAEKTNKE